MVYSFCYETHGWEKETLRERGREDERTRMYERDI